MYKLSEMIPGHRYLVGDGMGYDVVECIGLPSEEEMKDYEGCTAMKVRFVGGDLNGQEDIFCESEGYQLYIEPR